MLIRNKRSWEIPESQATPEDVFWNRRRFLKGAAGGIGLAALPGLAACSDNAVAREDDPTSDLYPAPRNDGFTLDRPVTEESVASNYNNFYEFGSSKRVAAAAQSLEIRPWSIMIDGLVEEPRSIDIDTLIRGVSLEERLYRLRCVEAWAMAVPWTGFPMRDLVAMARPLSSAKYVVMQTFEDSSIASGQRQAWYPWPYTEGLTIEEATHDLTMMVTGVYGQPIANQFGAPLRLIVPWKYGFKSIKSIMRITLTDTQPPASWNQANPREYGFYSNVNPEVDHPRWSQATERRVGGGLFSKRIPTRMFNGYEEEVASLYEGMDLEKHF